MPFRNYKKNSKKKPRKYFRGKRSGKARGVSVAVKSYVKSLMHKQIENKQAYYAAASQNISSYNVSSTMLALPLYPNSSYMSISQNVGESDRIGNKIRVVKAMFNYILRPEVYNATLNPTPTPQIVKLWLGYNKTTPLTQATGNPNFIQTGNTSQALTGYLIDIIKPVNKDLYKIYKTRTHKLGHAIENGTGSSAVAGYQSNNDFKMNASAKIDITRFLQKNIQFNDTTNTQTNGHGLFAYFTAVRADGLTNAAYPVTMDWWLDFYYEDA